MRWTLIRYGGLAGAVLLAVAGYLGGALPHLRPGRGPLVIVAWLAGTGLMVGAWWVARERVPGTRWAYATAGLWLLPLLVAPPLGSRDVYPYACQGAVYAAGLDPYHQTPVNLPCQWLDSVSPIWRDIPAPYGPLFVTLAGGAVHIGHSLTGTVILLRLVAVTGVALIAASVPVLARHAGVPTARAAWLALACPLIGVHLVAGAHNDALMVGLLAAGLAVAAGRTARPPALVAAGALLGLAVAVKATAAVTIPFAMLLALPAPRRPPRPATALDPITADRATADRAALDATTERAALDAAADGAAVDGSAPDGATPRGATSSGAAGAAVVGGAGPDGPVLRTAVLRAGAVAAGALAALAAASLASGLGLGWFVGLTHTGDSVQWTSPSTAVGMTVDYLGRAVGLHHSAVPATRALGLIALAALLVAMLCWAWRTRQPLLGAALALAATVALAPVFHPWYATWPLVLLAATWRGAPWPFALPAALAAFLVLPDGTALALYTKLPGALAMTTLVALLIVRTTRRHRRPWTGTVQNSMERH